MEEPCVADAEVAQHRVHCGSKSAIVVDCRMVRSWAARSPAMSAASTIDFVATA